MPYDVELVDLPAQQTAVVRGQVPHDGVGAFIGSAFGEVFGAVGRQGLQPAGMPFARYTVTEQGFDIEAGVAVDGELSPDGRVEASSLPGGPAATTVHTGDYAAIAPAYEAIERWLGEHGHPSAGPPWECYLDEPSVADPRTAVYFPCAAGRAD